MMATPEVTRYRPSSDPDKQVRPPPKNFTDFSAEASRPSSNPDGSKGTFVPKPSIEKEPETTELEATQTQQRLGLLEERIERLEDELEELTDAATKPTSSNTIEIISTFVRCAFVQGLMSHEAALTAIAMHLRIIDPTKRALPALPPVPPPAPPSTPAVVTQAVAAAPASEPDVGGRRGGRKRGPAVPGQAPRRRAVKQLLDAHGLSQNRVAAAAGMHQAALSKWLRGWDVSDEAFIVKVEKAVQKLV